MNVKASLPSKRLPGEVDLGSEPEWEDDAVNESPPTTPARVKPVGWGPIAAQRQEASKAPKRARGGQREEPDLIASMQQRSNEAQQDKSTHRERKAERQQVVKADHLQRLREAVKTQSANDEEVTLELEKSTDYVAAKAASEDNFKTVRELYETGKPRRLHEHYTFGAWVCRYEGCFCIMTKNRLFCLNCTATRQHSPHSYV